MDLSIFAIFVVFVILVLFTLITYKPFKVEVSEYMISVPNRKIYYQWKEIEKITIIFPQSQLSKPRLPLHLIQTNFEENHSFIVTPKNGKILSFKRSQVIKPHPTLNIDSVNELIERKKIEYKI